MSNEIEKNPKVEIEIGFDEPTGDDCASISLTYNMLMLKWWQDKQSKDSNIDSSIITNFYKHKANIRRANHER